MYSTHGGAKGGGGFRPALECPPVPDAIWARAGRRSGCSAVAAAGLGPMVTLEISPKRAKWCRQPTRSWSRNLPRRTEGLPPAGARATRSPAAGSVSTPLLVLDDARTGTSAKLLAGRPPTGKRLPDYGSHECGGGIAGAARDRQWADKKGWTCATARGWQAMDGLEIILETVLGHGGERLATCAQALAVP